MEVEISIKIGLFVLLGTILFIAFIFVMVMTYLEEKRKCKHRWVEVNRISGTNMLGGLATRVDLRCRVCGDVQSRNF